MRDYQSSAFRAFVCVVVLLGCLRPSLAVACERHRSFWQCAVLIIRQTPLTAWKIVGEVLCYKVRATFLSQLACAYLSYKA